MKNEMSRRQFLGFAGSAAAVLGLGLVGCGGSAGSGSSASGDAAEVYFLQFKPEVDKEWKEIAKAYKKEKGVEVKIVTAASNTYEEKLKSEMSKSSAPTLFQVNGPTGLKNWKDYCADLSDTKLRGELIDDSLALQSDGKDLGIDWVQESYGIIYNKELLEKAGYKAEDINSFDKLKACADDIQARKDELGVDGAFTSAGMDDSSSWRYTTHLANLPLYYEFEKEHNQEDDEIKGEYLDNFKQIFDLYITDSTCDPSQLASKTGATVYDCAFPDSSAACKYATYDPTYTKDHFNLYYVIECFRNNEFTAISSIAGDEPDPRFMDSVNVMKTVDMDKVDIIVIMYDSTDYNMGTPSDNPDNPYDVTAFTGGLRISIDNIKKTWPYIRVIVMSPTYAQAIDEDGNLYNGTTKDWGNGTLNHYLVKEADAVMDCGVSFIDNYYGTINEDNYQEYMTDYMRYNDAGREKLADRLADVINNKLSTVSSTAG